MYGHSFREILMKKLNLITFIAAYLVVACAPQVTVTSEVTVTLTPISTPTLHPEFAALQQTIADSGSRFTLGADGLLYDGETPIPGMTVAPDGTMTLTVNGETVTLDPADVDFDDEKGITIDGYEWDAEAGAWVEANETVTMGGVILTLDENGVVTEMEATGASEEIKAENLAKVDPMAWGFEKGEAQIVKNETGTHIVSEGQNVAKWVGTEWEWDGTKMELLPLFDGFAKTYPTTDSGAVIVTGEVHAEAARIRVFANEEGLKMSGGRRYYDYTIYLYDGDERADAMVARVLAKAKILDPNKDKSGVVDGWICFMTTSGDLVKMKFDDIEVFVRRFN
jgi:hypothetical protein